MILVFFFAYSDGNDKLYHDNCDNYDKLVILMTILMTMIKTV